MMVVLTEEEYNKLLLNTKALAEWEEKEYLKTLQELCTLACNHVQVEVSWLNEKIVWGCILNEGGNGHGYCDECPVTNMCPHEHKAWSK